MNIKGIIAIALVAVFVFAAGFYIPKFRNKIPTFKYEWKYFADAF